jgi:hypothetical protein
VATHSTTLRNAQANTLGAAVDAGSGAGRLRIYTGSKPASPASAATGTLLVDFTLNDPSFDTASSGVATLDVTPSISDSSADATGTAGYARFADSDGNGVLDCSVTATGGGGEVTLNTTSVTSGVVVALTGFTYTVPAGS